LSESTPDPKAPPKATPAVAFCFLANSLLERETWARERLEPFAGQGFEVRLPLVRPFSLVVAADGRLEPVAAAAAAIVTPGGISGDSALADELRYLRRHLRPDVEEELSRFVGDVAAHRLVGTARSFMQWQLDALARLGEAVADYAVNERRALVRRAELAELAERIEALNRAIARLEERL
jgi:ubiquinone biosynthesis protein UbiJ